MRDLFFTPAFYQEMEPGLFSLFQGSVFIRLLVQIEFSFHISSLVQLFYYILKSAIDRETYFKFPLDIFFIHMWYIPRFSSQ